MPFIGRREARLPACVQPVRNEAVGKRMVMMKDDKQLHFYEQKLLKSVRRQAAIEYLVQRNAQTARQKPLETLARTQANVVKVRIRVIVRYWKQKKGEEHRAILPSTDEDTAKNHDRIHEE